MRKCDKRFLQILVGIANCDNNYKARRNTANIPTQSKRKN